MAPLRSAHIAGVVFDLDGTLYLQAPLRRAVAWRMLWAAIANPGRVCREGVALHHFRRAQEQLRTRPDVPVAAQLETAAGTCGEDPAHVAAAVARWMDEVPLDLLGRYLRPGIVQLLEAAERKGLRLAVLSDYPAERKLRAMGLDKYFSLVISAQDPRVGRFKPSPEGLHTAITELGLGPDRALYVGDRPSVDGEAARRAGVAGVILGQPHGSDGPGWIGVPDVRSLRALLSVD